MSSEKHNHSGEKSKWNIKSTTALAVGIGTAMGLSDALRTTLDDHRTKTHRSTKPHPLLTRAMEFSARSLGGSSQRNWPDAHLDHHAFADVNLFPFLRVSRALDWVEKHGEDHGVAIPSHIDHLDPLVDNGRYPLAKVREIGSLAEKHVIEKAGDLYEAPISYTKEELHDILYPEKPDYAYPKYKKKRRGDYTSDDIAKVLTRDPHSPVYADKDEKNGVKKILRTGTFPYMAATDLRNAYPEVIWPHLQLPEGENVKKVWPAVAAGVIAPTLAVLAARGKYEPKDLGIAVAGGAIAVGARGAFVAGGSMAVNSLGHAGGELNTRKIIQAMLGKNFKIGLNPDGTVSADTTSAGLFGRITSLLSADEVGRQGFHHEDPGARKYTDKDGIEGVFEAAWGSVVDAVAKSRFSIIEPGDNFNLKPGERRPDEPHPATLLVMERRKEQYKADKAKEKVIFQRR